MLSYFSSFKYILFISAFTVSGMTLLIHHDGFAAAQEQLIGACGSCHPDWKDSETTKDTFKPEVRLSDQQLCISCHTNEDLEKHYQISPAPFIESYQKSIHGGDTSISCFDCHKTCYHGFQGGIPPSSLRIKTNVPAACGVCHTDELNAYSASIHGTAISKNILEAPVCTDCHGEHYILSPTDAYSSVAAKNIPRTCGACHEKEQLAIRYGIAANRLSTYRESYHGMANRLGEENAANCVSCHEYHNIFAPSDTRSAVHPGNLSKTCGKCHQGATSRLLNSKIHVEVSKEDSKGAWYVRKFYTYFIGILMFLFLVYVFLDISFRIRKSRRG